MDSGHPYHHGKLKQALVDAAIVLVAEVGTQGFTLREVARRAGVSHNAPYRHFRDRSELLAAVAMQGFQRLTASMKRSAAHGTDAGEQLRFCGRGYVKFALRWPEHFAVMFDLPSRRESHPEYQAAGQEAFDTLLGYIVRCQEVGILPSGDAQPLALACWSLVHGIAKLAVSHQLPLNRAAIPGFTDQVTSLQLAGFSSSREGTPSKPVANSRENRLWPCESPGPFLSSRRAFSLPTRYPWS
jgi:AcrR family transcriptional regulator